jgi:hypothetical protein
MLEESSALRVGSESFDIKLVDDFSGTLLVDGKLEAYASVSITGFSFSVQGKSMSAVDDMPCFDF